MEELWGITEKDFSDVDMITTEELTLPIKIRGVYNMNGVKVSDSVDNLPSGIYIVMSDSKSKKIVIP